MKDLINRIEKLKAEIPQLSAEQQRVFWEKLRLEWNYNSNHIEGNTLTYGETKLLLIKGETTGNHSKREYDEMEAHDVAVAKVREWAADEERGITESDIRELNKIILVKNFWKEAITGDGQPTRTEIKVGQYKDAPNHVRLPNGEIFHYANVEETPAKMEELINWYREENDLPPVIKAAELHYRFVRIHPFGDGNGRIARLLMNYVLLRHGFPPIVIMSADKKNYLSALSRADAGMRGDFHEYIAKQLLWSLELKQKARKGESLEEADDLDKYLEIFRRELTAEGDENEIQTQLNRDSLFTALNSWGYDLLQNLAVVTAKFNEFYTDPKHYISFKTSTTVHSVRFINDLNIDEIQSQLNDTISPEENLIEFNIRLQTHFGSFKKGGLNSFGCNYPVEIRFELLKYSVCTGEFFPKGGKNACSKDFFEKLLHIPLSQKEIKDINTHWGNILLHHLQYHQKKLKLKK